MAERRPPTTAQLEVALARLAPELDFPPTPPIAEAVVARLGAAPRRPARRPIPGWLLAAAVLLALLLGALAGSPPLRTAVADRLGLRGVDLTHIPFVPAPTPTAISTPAPTNVPTPTPPPAGAGLGLGDPVDFATAGGRLGFVPVRPTAPELGEPDEAYVVADAPPGGRLSLVYRARAGLPPAAQTGVGLLLVQFRGDVDPAFLGKGLGPGTRVEAVDVAGGRGYWIEGEPHFVLFRGADGNWRDDQVRLAGSVLLWERGALTLRIEGALGRDAALRIAASVR